MYPTIRTSRRPRSRSLSVCGVLACLVYVCMYGRLSLCLDPFLSFTTFVRRVLFAAACGLVAWRGAACVDQGRESEQLFPYGIYTIPEVSMIGKTEAQLTAEGVSYEVSALPTRLLYFVLGCKRMVRFISACVFFSPAAPPPLPSRSRSSARTPGLHTPSVLQTGGGVHTQVSIFLSKVRVVVDFPLQNLGRDCFFR